jgi:ligand-binding sensor domain-containing protein
VALERTIWGKAMRRWAMHSWLCLLGLMLSGVAGASVPLLPQPRQISVFDGLPSNRVNAIAEDRRGYLWIATRDGLARYDGVGFRVWRTGEGLRDDFVWSVHVDADDRVWIGTSKAGLAMLDGDRDRFTWHDRATRPEMASTSASAPRAKAASRRSRTKAGRATCRAASRKRR